MTKQRIDDHSTEFGIWLRKQPEIDSRKGFDAQNLDYIWLAFKKGWFILIEEKRFNSDSSLSQKDTHNIIHQLLQASIGTKVSTLRGNRIIEYCGYYLIQFQNTNPDDSQWIKINGNIHDKNDLLLLLRFGKLINLKETSKNLKYSTVTDLANQLSKLLQLKIDIGIAVQYIEEKNIVLHQ